MTSVFTPTVPFTQLRLSPSTGPLVAEMDGALGHHEIKDEAEEKPRGRRRSRAQNTIKDKNGPGSAIDGVDGHSSEADGPSRKRRRSRKGLDKKFECPQEGCGKSYSRAEHL